jgi:four helix bundle protein
MGVSGKYWSACRGRTSNEFISKLAVATDESEENVLWLTVIAHAGIRDDAETAELIQEGTELRAILSKSTRTARENRRRRRKES